LTFHLFEDDSPGGDQQELQELGGAVAG